MKEPKTLMEAVAYFSDADRCREYVASRRWPSGVTCPVCGSTHVTFLPSVNRYQCAKRHPKRQFTIKTGSIFEDSPLPLDKWLIAMWLIVNCKNGVSSYEVHRAIGVTQKTAWFMLQRIRLAMQNKSVEKLGGKVEADETYIGGKITNMHTWRQQCYPRTADNKVAVMGILGRGGDVRAFVIENTRLDTIQTAVRTNVDKGSRVFTDALGAYRSLNPDYRHEFVSHMGEYVRGEVHTNSLENFWSLLKRTLKGTYINVEPFHLFRYLDEQAFRFNNRKPNDRMRMSVAVDGVAGRRLTYMELTGGVSQA